MEQMLLNYKQHGERIQWLEMFQYLLLHRQLLIQQNQHEYHQPKDYKVN